MGLLKQGHSGDAVNALQNQLNTVGCTCEVDGLFGPGTRQAVENFQKAFSLEPDGVVGPATQAKLAEQVAAAEAQKGSPAS